MFHTKSDLVTSETMQMKKLQRINEINRALLEADRAAEEPEELLDSLNPMESREKAVDGLKNSRSRRATSEIPWLSPETTSRRCPAARPSTSRSILR